MTGALRLLSAHSISKIRQRVGREMFVPKNTYVFLTRGKWKDSAWRVLRERWRGWMRKMAFSVNMPITSSKINSGFTNWYVEWFLSCLRLPLSPSSSSAVSLARYLHLYVYRASSTILSSPAVVRTRLSLPSYHSPQPWLSLARFVSRFYSSLYIPCSPTHPGERQQARTHAGIRERECVATTVDLILL